MAFRHAPASNSAGCLGQYPPNSRAAASARSGRTAVIPAGWARPSSHGAIASSTASASTAQSDEPCLVRCHIRLGTRMGADPEGGEHVLRCAAANSLIAVNHVPHPARRRRDGQQRAQRILSPGSATQRSRVGHGKMRQLPISTALSPGIPAHRTFVVYPYRTRSRHPAAAIRVSGRPLPYIREETNRRANRPKRLCRGLARPRVTACKPDHVKCARRVVLEVQQIVGQARMGTTHCRHLPVLAVGLALTSQTNPYPALLQGKDWSRSASHLSSSAGPREAR
jgi:hypothetical protein